MSEHTPGAIEAARIIIRGKKRIHTEYGFKTVRGLADLIDKQTAAPELLEAIKALTEVSHLINVRQHANAPIGPEVWSESHRAENAARAAIAKAKETP